VSRELSSNSIDLLDDREEVGVDTQTTDRKLIRAPELGQLTVRKTSSFALLS